MGSNIADTPCSFITSEQVNFMETDWPQGHGCARTWLISKSSAEVPAVNHSSVDPGRCADNTDPFEVEVVWPVVP